MNKNRLMAAGSLLAIGAMFPITTGALMGAKTPPAEPAVMATATPAPTLKGTDPLATPPAPEPTAVNPEPTYSSIAVGPGTVPAPAQTAPACPEGTLPAEDGSCVNPGFWDEPAPIQEDDPAWDCMRDGNQLCGVDPAMLEDAWSSFDAEAVAGVVGKTVAFSASYVGTSAAMSIPGYWVVPSLQHSNTFHVFMIQPGE